MSSAKEQVEAKKNRVVMNTLGIRLRFLQPVLGTISGDKELATKFIIEKALEAGEITEQAAEQEKVALPETDPDEELEKQTTWFAKDGAGDPFVWNYWIKGQFKTACTMLRQVDSASKELTNHRKKISEAIFIGPRQLKLLLPEGAKCSIMERPLRGQTARGERICLARSECAPEGTQIQFVVRFLVESWREAVREWLDYGQFYGLGQWRNAEWGIFDWEEIDPEEAAKDLTK